MVKRICSLVLLFSCFCSLSLFLVAHAEDPDGLDFFPPDYEGTDLPGFESSGISTFAASDNPVSGYTWSLWTVQSGTVKNIPQPWRVGATTSSNFDSTYILNLTDIPAHTFTLSTEPKDFMSPEYVHCMSYSCVRFSSLASAFTSNGGTMYSYFAAMSSSMPRGSVSGWTRGYSTASGRFSVTSPPDSVGDFVIYPGSSFYIPENTKIKLRVSFNGSGGIANDAFISIDGGGPRTLYSRDIHGNYLENVVSFDNGSWVGGSNKAFFIRGVSPLSDGTLEIIGFEVSLYDSASDDVIGAINNQTEQLDQSIFDAGKGVEDKIESSFDTSASAGIGSDVQDFADQANSSLGVVSYVDTVFSGLSDLVVAGSTTLTFPSVSIEVEGFPYQLWPDYTFDLAELDGWLSGLMAVVRLATSAVVVGAVISYLQHVYKEVIG